MPRELHLGQVVEEEVDLGGHGLEAFLNHPANQNRRTQWGKTKTKKIRWRCRSSQAFVLYNSNVNLEL